MLRVTQDVVEIRHWVESRGGRPCRRPEDGRLAVGFPGEPCHETDVDWGEFEPTFLIGHSVFVYDDAPGSRRWFIGNEAEAHRFLAEHVREVSAPPP